MSNFDILLGMDDSILNRGIAALYGNSTTREKYFKGSETVAPITVTFDILAAPTVTLAPPSQDVWTKALPKQKAASPPSDCVQMTATSVKITETAGGSSVPLTTSITVYLTASATGGKLALDPLAVTIDESMLSTWDQSTVNTIVIPGLLKMGQKALSGISLPALPSLGGLKFNSMSLQVAGGHLMVAATTTSNTKPVSFDGYSQPDKSFYIQVSNSAFQSALSGNLSSWEGKTFRGSKTAGTQPLAWATLNYSVDVKTLTPTVQKDDATKVSFAVGPDISVSGNWGADKAAVCPIGAALHLL